MGKVIPVDFKNKMRLPDEALDNRSNEPLADLSSDDYLVPEVLHQDSRGTLISDCGGFVTFIPSNPDPGLGAIMGLGWGLSDDEDAG